MTRIKRGMLHAKRRRGLLEHTKGFRWGRKSKIKLARTAVMKAGAHAFASRRIKKREFRANWNVNINAAVRAFGLNYSRFIGLLKKKNIALDRKILAQLAENNKKIFQAVVEAVK